MVSIHLLKYNKGSRYDVTWLASLGMTIPHTFVPEDFNKEITFHTRCGLKDLKLGLRELDGYQKKARVNRLIA